MATNQIDKVYIQTYERTVRHLAQQGTSRLRPFVTERPVGGENHNWERLAEGTSSAKVNGVLTPTPTNDIDFSRRVSVAKTQHTATSTEQEDPSMMLVDPNSNLAQSQAMAMKRAYDDEIIAAATGNSLDGDGNAVAFPAGQILGSGATVLSFDLVTQVTEKFLENDVDPDEPKVFVIGPVQVRKLLQLDQVTSSDYVALQALINGQVAYWMGYTWICSTRLLSPLAGEITCFAMTRRALGLQVNKDIWTKVAEDPSQSFAWRIYTASTFGATRVEDEHIVQVHLSDSV